MTPNLALILSIGQSLPAAGPVVITPVAPAPSPPVAAPPIRIAPATEKWPETPAGKPISAPDWSDYRLYPPAALELDQEGRVSVEALVGTDGAPRACRIRTSSGYSELDTGTCNLMNLLRFSPPRDAQGRPLESVYRRAFLWLTSDPTPFEAASMTVRLRLARGAVTDCRLEPHGPVPPEWTKLACRVVTAEVSYFLNGRRSTASAATLVFGVEPGGAETAAAEPGEPAPAAEWRSAFSLEPNGDVTACRLVVDRGFGPVPDNHQSSCGFFLTRAWFTPAGPEAPATGIYSLKVYIDR
jgi:TonB family protein